MSWPGRRPSPRTVTRNLPLPEGAAAAARVKDPRSRAQDHPLRGRRKHRRVTQARQRRKRQPRHPPAGALTRGGRRRHRHWHRHRRRRRHRQHHRKGMGETATNSPRQQTKVQDSRLREKQARTRLLSERRRLRTPRRRVQRRATRGSPSLTCIWHWRPWRGRERGRRLAAGWIPTNVLGFARNGRGNVGFQVFSIGRFWSPHGRWQTR